jgi:hypothetical protein
MAALGCGTPGDLTDGSVGDATGEPDAGCIVSFSEALTCLDASPADAAACSNPPEGITQDGGFGIGCSIIENDHTELMDGACRTPTYTCVGPSPHWEVSWSP